MKINGIVLINKDRGVSSNAVVNKVKWLLKADKAGHYGTLDVLGEGLLPVALGKGTKLFGYFLSKDKVYKTTFIFGKTTPTLDLEGEFTATDDKKITKQDVEKVLPQLIGEINQMPPQYSAKKVGGKRAYDVARAGGEIELSPKRIEIYSIKLLREVEENTFEFEVWCSSGTYIRSLCRDMATALGTIGVMSNIQRTRCGIFDLKDAVTLKELEQGKLHIISLDKVIDLPKINVTEEEKIKLLNGGIIYKEVNYECFNCFCGDEYLGVIREDDYGAIKLIQRLID